MDGQTTDAKPAEASSTPETPLTNTTNQTSTPEPANVSSDNAGTKAITEKVDEPKPFHEHPRWQEVIREKNEYKTKALELEAKLAEYSKTQEDPTISMAVKQLVDTGVDESVAKAIVKSNYMLSARVAEETVAPFQAKTAKQEVDSWFGNMRETHKENFEAYERRMFDRYSKLTPAMKDLVVADAEGLELLYYAEMGRDADRIRSEAYQKGADEAAKSRAAKAAVTSTPGASAANSNRLTRENIFDMPNDAKTLREIWERRNELVD